MVVALEDGEVSFWPGLHDGIPVLEVVLYAAELPEGMALELLWELREWPVFERVSDHAAEIAVGKGFACLYDVQKFDEEFYSVWFKSIGNGVRWSNDNCYMTLEQAEDSFDERTINGNGYALIRTDGSGNLEDKSSWILQRYVWNHK